MTDHKSPLEMALDVLLYAPVGLVVTAAEEFPRLIEKGRQRVTRRVGMAKALGQYAASQGAHEAGKAVKQAAGALTGLGVVPGPRPSPPGGGQGGSGQGGRVSSSAPSLSTAASPSTASANGSGDRRAVVAPPKAGLGIPGYDALSASQVVQRLDGLAPEELQAVLEYELPDGLGSQNAARHNGCLRIAQRVKSCIR